MDEKLKNRLKSAVSRQELTQPGKARTENSRNSGNFFKLDNWQMFSGIEIRNLKFHMGKGLGKGSVGEGV